MNFLYAESISIYKNNECIQAYTIYNINRMFCDDYDISKLCMIDKKYYRRLMKKYNGVLDRDLMVYFLDIDDCVKAIKFLEETFLWVDKLIM